MSEFSSLDTGEAIVGAQKKNDSLECPEGGDAAAIAGAAIAGAALLGAAAVGAATSSLLSNGVGATTEAQAAAGAFIGETTENAATLLSDAKANALAAIGFGPGGEGSTALAEGQAEIDAAQQQASALAGEVRAGVDAAVADAQAAIAAGQAFIDNSIAEGQALFAEGTAAAQAKVQGLIGQALGAVPPLPGALAAPTPGALPIPPLPVDVPIASKVIPTEVAVPPVNLAIPSPKSVASSAATAVVTRTGVTTEATLEEAALSRDQINECLNERIRLDEDLETFKTEWLALINELVIEANTVERVGEAFGVGRSTERQGAALLVSLSLGNGPLQVGQHPNAPSPFYRLRRAIIGNGLSSDIKQRLESGPLLGSEVITNVIDIAQGKVNFRLTCDQLAPYKSFAGQLGAFSSALAAIQSNAVGEFFDNNDVDEQTRFLNTVVPEWITVTDIVLTLPSDVLEAANFPAV